MTDQDWNLVKLRTSKSWQGKEPIYVFQSSFSRFKHEAAKKFFIIVDTRQDSFGVRLSSSKPESLIPQGGMVNQVRKHCKGATVGDIFKDESNGNIWILMYFAGQEWFIRLAKSRPPEMSLVSPDKVMLMRFGMKGTFTKKADVEEELPSHSNPQFKTIKGQIIEEFLETLPKPGDEDENGIDEDIDDQEDSDLLKEQRILIQKLKRKLKTYRKSIEKQIEKLPSEEDIANTQKHANLLQNFGYLWKDGSLSIDLPSPITGEPEDIEISVDPEKSLGANIESYFVKAKKSRRSLDMGRKVLDKNRGDLQQLEADLDSLKEQKSLSEVELLFDKYKLPRVQASNNKEKVAAVSKPYRTFLSSTGHPILVGKGPRENDELTKSAKTNDYWIHTSAVAGSHVIVPASKDIRQDLPPALLREASILAIHYSKLKEDLAGEVYLARRASIKKQKGMPAGLWNVERCKTIFFRYTADELKNLQNRLQK